MQVSKKKSIKKFLKIEIQEKEQSWNYKNWKKKGKKKKLNKLKEIEFKKKIEKN